jgi:ABC-type histidine transport system ATPase subunit
VRLGFDPSTAVGKKRQMKKISQRLGKVFIKYTLKTHKLVLATS